MDSLGSSLLKQVCEQIELALQLARNGKYATAKIMLITSSEQIMVMLKEKKLSLQESTHAQQQLTIAVRYAEECKKQIELAQNQLAQSDPHIKMIYENLVIKKTGISFKDIAGLDGIKQTLKESVILPNLRPDIFTGIRAPHKGILFYGPPGNGKTLLAKAVATEAKCCFMNLSAASLVQKFMGEGEKLMRALFRAATASSPCIIFIDEIDSILSTRSENEHEASRRLKTEFLIQFDGMQSSDQDRVVLMGATNRPQEIDHAALRRFTLRIHIDQPDEEARQQLVTSLLADVKNSLKSGDIVKIVQRLKGYSASDIKSVVKEACMEPVRSEINKNMIMTVTKQEIRDVSIRDFERALNTIKPALTAKQVETYNQFKHLK